ncbi:MAG: TVP38/TMEM64 family protein [Verrucomicrobia bacterium]|nr:TVP38/TMEM64 family protein [Verrucomicrobiota bacterium]
MMPFGSKWKWAVGAALAILAIGSTSFLPVQSWLQKSLDGINGLGSLGPVLFVLIYAGATLLFVPGSILTLGAGALFGVVKGCLCVSLASTLGATGAFLAGRHLARDWVARKVSTRATFAAMDKAVAEEGWKIVVLTRLSPVFPFTLLNYAYGLTCVSLKDYVLASWIGMMPGTVMYVYLGSLARAGASGQHRSTAEWALYGLGLLATLGVTLLIARMARRALKQRIGI